MWNELEDSQNQGHIEVVLDKSRLSRIPSGLASFVVSSTACRILVTRRVQRSPALLHPP